MTRLLLALFLMLTLLPAQAQEAVPESPEEERSLFLSWVEDRLSTPNRQIRIHGIHGVLSSVATIEEITVADREGVWLRIVNASINWSRSTLIFQQRLEISRLAADSIEVLRRPVPAEGLPAPEAWDIAVPEFPIAINLAELAIANVAFGRDVFGLESALSVEGRLRLEAGSLDTALEIERLDGPGGHLSLAVAYDNRTDEIDLDFTLDEPQNGVLANLLNIEGRPPLALTLAGAGPVDNLDVELSLAAAGEPALDGTARFRPRAEGVGFTVDVGGPIARLVPARFRPFFGAETTLQAAGLARTEGGVVLDTFNLRSAALALEATAETAPDGFLTALTVDARIADPGGERVVLPVSGAPTVRTVTLTADYGDGGTEAWQALLDIAELQTETFAAESTRLAMGGEAANLAEPEERRITFQADGTLTGITAARPEMARALGETVHLAAEGAWSAGQPFTLTSSRLVAQSFTAGLAGTVAEFAFDGDFTLEADDITPFSGLAGRQLGGSLDLTASGELRPVSGAFDLVLDGTGVDLSIDNPAVDALMGGTTRITGRLARDVDGFTADALRIANPQVELVANGTFATEATDFRFDAALADLALVTERAEGRVTASGRAQGDADALNLAFQAEVPRGRLLDRPLSEAVIGFDGTLREERLSGGIDGDAFLGGVRATLAAGLDATPEAQSLTDIDFVAGGARLTGDIARDEARLFTGRLALEAADISTAAALFLIEASGAVEAELSLEPRQGEQHAAISATLSGIVAERFSLRQGAVEAAIADLFGVPAVEGTLEASGLSAAGVNVATLSASAETAQDATAFAADAELEIGTDISVRGGLAPQPGGYVVSLDTASLQQAGIAARLVAPARLSVAGQTITFEPIELDVAGGRVTAAGTVAQTANVDISVEALPLSIANTVRPDLGLSGTVDGQMRVSGPRAEPQATFTLAGRGIGAAALAETGITPLAVDLTGAAGPRLASIEAQITSPAGLDATVSGNVPIGEGRLALGVNGTFPLGLANRFLIERGTQLAGTVAVNLRVGGSLADPVVNGTVSTTGATVIDPMTNVRLTAINVEAGLADRTVTIHTGSAAFAAGGTVSLTGTVRIDAAAGYPANLAISLNEARYTDGELLTATLSGSLSLTGPLTRDPLLAGNLSVSRAEIIVPERFGAAAADIPVRHVRTPPAVQETLRRARADDGTPMPTRRPSVLRLDVTVDAPARIFVRGRGLDAELGGSVRLTGPVTSIQPVGAFQLIRGRLNILGRRITFDEGTVSLVGDLDPQLDFVARSVGRDFTAFIIVSGRVSDLDIRFASQPDLPEDEVLARLIFGRSVNELSPLQLAQLAAAAAELAGGTETTLLGTLRQAAGLDELDIVTDAEGNLAVRAGRYIQENVYVGVETAADGDTRATINLDITEDLRARGSLGTAGDSSLGIFFERDY